MTRHPLTQRMVRVWLSLALVATAMVYAMAVARPAAAEQAVTVSLSGMTPTVATSSTQQLTLTGQLTVPSGQSHDDVIVQLAYTEVQFRSDMSQGPGNDTPLYNVQNHLGDLTSGTYTWRLTTSLAALDASPNNVYALDVQAFSGGEPLGALRTYLPYEIGGGGEIPDTTRLTVLAPVTAPSPLDGYQESGTTYEELTENTLAQQMGTDGSLYQLLAAGAQLPQGMISWAVDPDLLDTAAQIEDGYVVAKPGTAGDAVGPDTSDAGAWLKEAKTVLHADGELWQLPSTDPDLGSLSDAPQDTADAILASAAQHATTGGSVKNAVGIDPRGLIAWPADGEVSGRTLALAQSIDPTAVVVDSDSVGLSVPDETYTPTGRATIGGKSNVVVADSALDSIMDGDPADAAYTSDGSNATVLAGQRLLAQTALIALDKPNLGRDVMLTLPRSSDTAAKDMAVLADLRAADWLKPTGLSTLLAQSPDPSASTHTPKRSSAVADTDLTSDQLDEVLDLDSQLQLYQSILTTKSTGTSGFAGAVLRSVSTGWRGQSAAWTDFTTTVSDKLQAQMDQVSLIPKSDLTLSGTTGSIPFTVVNHLPQAVQLGLAVTTDRSGLHVTQIPVRKFATGTTTIEVKVNSTVAPGSKVQVTAYLVNSAGLHYGSVPSGGSRSLQVTVTSIGFVAMLLFAGSAALLVFAVGLRIYRGRRGSRSELETQAGD